MSRVRYNVAMSLDGFIAGPEGPTGLPASRILTSRSCGRSLTLVSWAAGPGKRPPGGWAPQHFRRSLPGADPAAFIRASGLPHGQGLFALRCSALTPAA
jgi:hypothetical protein